jgi:hypothetical protein
MVETTQTVQVADLSAEQTYAEGDPEAVTGVELGAIGRFSSCRCSGKTS